MKNKKQPPRNLVKPLNEVAPQSGVKRLNITSGKPAATSVRGLPKFRSVSVRSVSGLSYPVRGKLGLSLAEERS
jgi:hypothetical protein